MRRALPTHGPPSALGWSGAGEGQGAELTCSSLCRQVMVAFRGGGVATMAFPRQPKTQVLGSASCALFAGRAPLPVPTLTALPSRHGGEPQTTASQQARAHLEAARGERQPMGDRHQLPWDSPGRGGEGRGGTLPPHLQRGVRPSRWRSRPHKRAPTPFAVALYTG